MVHGARMPGQQSTVDGSGETMSSDKSKCDLSRLFQAKPS